jgi:hypothetical protein
VPSGGNSGFSAIMNGFTPATFMLIRGTAFKFGKLAEIVLVDSN